MKPLISSTLVKNSRRLLAGVTAAALALTVAACSSNDSGSASDSDSLKVGIKYDQPGMGLKEGSEYTGFDTDVARYIAQKMGKDPEKIEWIQTPSAQRETMISTGQVDFIVASYSITEKREEQVSFAGPYLIAGQDLLVRADDNSITGPETLSGKKLCSVNGSTSAQTIKDQYPDVQLQNMSTYSECVAGLVAGSVDALTTDDSILVGYATQDMYKGKLKVVGKPFTQENYGVGIKKGDTALCQQINQALTDMVADGTWQSTIEKDLPGYTPQKGNPPTPQPCK